MIKRRSPRQQKQRTAKVQNESQSQTSGLKRSRISEEKSSKKRKASDNGYSVGRKRSTFEEKTPNKQKDFDETCDNYCWKCHKYCQDEKCSLCNRVYCFKCFKGHGNQICEACHQQNASEEAFSTIADTSGLLLSVIETSFPENKIKNKRLLNWQPKASEVKLCHIVDYTYIDSKSKDTDGLQYRSPAELLDDVKWVYHNCVIIYGEQHDITKEAKKILKNFTQEIDDLSDCAECYRKMFLNICDTPHPLIMAKQKSYPPWPAKCLRVLDSKAHVRYFGGSHEMAKVPLKDCYFVSEDCFGQKSKRFEKAKEEFDKYIKLFEETFGEDYPYQPKDTPFNEEVGKDLMKRVKEKCANCKEHATIFCCDNGNVVTLYCSTKCQKEHESFHSKYCSQVKQNTGEYQYQRAQRASFTSHSNCRVIDLTEDDDYRDSKIAVDAISEENEQPQLQNSDDSETSSLLNAAPGNSGASCSLFSSNGSPNSIFSPGPSIPYNSQPRNNWLLPAYGSTNESGISISNVYSGTDPNPLPEFDLNAQDTNFLTNDSSHGVQTVPSFGMPPSSITAEAENNNRGEADDDIQVVEELDTQRHGVKYRHIDDNLVQVILCRDPAAYSILQAANDLVRHLFVKFWGIANGVRNAPEILSAQEEKIKKLKRDKNDLIRDKAQLITECADRVANADSILKSIYSVKCDSLQQKNKELEETINNISKELNFYKNSLERLKEVSNDYKKNSYNPPPSIGASSVLGVFSVEKTVEKTFVMTKKNWRSRVLKYDFLQFKVQKMFTSPCS